MPTPQYRNKPRVVGGDHVRSLIARAGGRKAVADYFKISLPAVHYWPHVPAARVRGMSELTGLTPREIRPDLF